MSSVRDGVAVALAVALLVAGCTSSGSPGKGFGADGGVPSSSGGSGSLLPTDIYALPSFDFETYQQLGRQLHGTPALVNIWSSWCGPCRSEAPDLASAARTYRHRVQFLGVDILDQRDAAIAFMKHYNWSYPSVFDAHGEIRDRLGFIGQPETLFYDAVGQLVATWIGPLTPEVLDTDLHEILS